MERRRSGISVILSVFLILAFVAGLIVPDASAAQVGKKKKGFSAKRKKPVAAAKAKAGASKAPSLSRESVVADDEPAAVEAAPAPKKKKSKKAARKAETVKADEISEPEVVIDSDDVHEAPLSAQGKSPAQALKKESAAKPKAVSAAKTEKPTFWDKFLGNSESRLKWFPGLYLNVGANSLIDTSTDTRKLWTKLGVIPRFSWDKLSFAYDLTFHFDENNVVRHGDWDSVDDFIRKIYYIYYGEPGDRLTSRIEMMDDVTLGSGAIFRNYCGSLRYPLLDRKLSSLTTWNSGYDDFAKFFVDDIASPGIYGVSAEIMPHRSLQLGAQFVSDNKVNTGFRNENISVGSVHLAIPLIRDSETKFKIYEEVGSIYHFGTGMHTGMVTEVNNLTFKNEFRVFSSNYIPNYFDTLYEMERHYKGRALVRLADTGERFSGWYNEVKAKVSDSYTLRLSYEKDYAPFLVPMLSLGVDYTGMEYNKLKLSFNYDRKNMYYSTIRTSGAIYGVKARYDISDSSSMTYEMRHVLDLNGRPVDSINIETQLKF